MRFTFARAAMAATASVWLLLTVACNKEPLENIIAPPPPPVADTAFVMNNPVDQVLLLKLINDIRARGCDCGDTVMGPAPALRWNKSLERAAYLHSKDMEAKDYFAHNDKEGRNAGYRISTMGYPWQSWGENIALGILTEYSVVDGWSKSPVHCRVMMNASFSETGIARIGYFWTQELASPKTATH
ncbi:CAP domain-containing protein [Chitinophaga sp. XS-30]|uniref:CAP domain-containing protein n=1 Tax=Chitinophaga sp. XS-30 TaxID=2604421 RepID=UPI0011DD59DE|nr:CAP domain-containing protein [Chitinophaga sp. XS-30]QEH40104.1 CAP domain-containing protein [Chitinophaga sp. XS-30]